MHVHGHTPSTVAYKKEKVLVILHYYNFYMTSAEHMYCQYQELCTVIKYFAAAASDI